MSHPTIGRCNSRFSFNDGTQAYCQLGPYHPNMHSCSDLDGPLVATWRDEDADKNNIYQLASHVALELKNLEANNEMGILRSLTKIIPYDPEGGRVIDDC